MKPPMPKRNPHHHWPRASSQPPVLRLSITITVGAAAAALFCIGVFTTACLAQSPDLTAYRQPAAASGGNDVVEQTTMLDSAFVRTIFHAVRDFTFRWIVATANTQPSPKYLAQQSEQFPCDLRLGRSGTPPTSVHRLRPGKIYTLLYIILVLCIFVTLRHKSRVIVFIFRISKEHQWGTEFARLIDQPINNWQHANDVIDVGRGQSVRFVCTIHSWRCCQTISKFNVSSCDAVKPNVIAVKPNDDLIHDSIWPRALSVLLNQIR